MIPALVKEREAARDRKKRSLKHLICVLNTIHIIRILFLQSKLGSQIERINRVCVNTVFRFDFHSIPVFAQFQINSRLRKCINLMISHHRMPHHHHHHSRIWMTKKICNHNKIKRKGSENNMKLKSMHTTKFYQWNSNKFLSISNQQTFLRRDETKYARI